MAVEQEKDDAVSVVLGGVDHVRCERYDVHASVLQQPAAFSMVLSSAKALPRDIIQRYPPGTKFELRVGGFPQFTGEIDGFESEDSAGTTVLLHGRDFVARVYDEDVDADRQFVNSTYEDIVKVALKECGLGDRLLVTSNEANRRIKSGFNVATILEPNVTKQVKTVNQGAQVKRIIHSRLGESWLAFLERHLAKIGIFLWCDCTGNFVLSTPNPAQKPSFHFIKQRGQLRNVCNVELVNFAHDTSKRFAEVVIFARNHGKYRNKTHGHFVDDEMVALGFKRRRVYRDVNVNTAKEAEFYARRKIAEANRAAWRLKYVFSGHIAPRIGGGVGVVGNDLVATVDDDDNGIHDDLYIESVQYRSPPKTTVVTMMRRQDLVFGSEDMFDGYTPPPATAYVHPLKKVSSVNLSDAELFGLVPTLINSR